VQTTAQVIIMSSPTLTDSILRHPPYRTRPQPHRDETDPDVLHDHIGELRGELVGVAGGHRNVHMRTEMDASVLHGQIEVLNQRLAQAYITQAGLPAGSHRSDCAINRAPALRPGRCDCGVAVRRAVATA
jgi:hypothetical protein